MSKIDLDLDWELFVEVNFYMLLDKFMKACPDNYKECMLITLRILINEEEINNTKSFTFWKLVLDKLNSYEAAED